MKKLLSIFSAIALLLVMSFPAAADTNTTHYSFIEPTIGGSQTTWGTKLNTNFTNLDTALYNAAFGIPQWCGVAGGTANVLTMTCSPALTAYADGIIVRAKTGASPNSGDTTINVNAIGAVHVYQANESTLMTGGELPANTDVSFLIKTTGGNKAILLNATSGSSFSTLTVSGNATIGGTLGITGDVSVATNKFNITAASGNTAIAGTLGVAGDVAIATNKFTVTAASGNTAIAGTLGITGDVAVATNKLTVAAASGNTAIAGTLGVTGVITGPGSGITNLSGSNIASGTVPTARLGSGSASSSNFLRGDSTWAAPGGFTSCTIVSATGGGVTATCAGGYFVTGGGVKCPNTTNRIFQSYPASTTSWSGSCETQTGADVTYAVCCH